MIATMTKPPDAHPLLPVDTTRAPWRSYPCPRCGKTHEHTDGHVLVSKDGEMIIIARVCWRCGFCGHLRRWAPAVPR